MMAPEGSISRDAVDFLLNVVEHPRMGVSGAVLQDGFAHLAEPLIGGGWLVPCGVNTIIDGEDDQSFYELEWDPESKRYRYFAGSLGWVEVDSARLKTYTVDVKGLLLLLGHHLEIPRSYRITCLHERLLWYLGPARFGGARAHMYFARRLGDPRNRQAFRQAMGLERGKRPAIVLHGSRTEPTWMDSPLDERVVPLHKVFNREGHDFSVDRDVIRAVLGAGPDPSQQVDPGLRFTTDYRTVYWYGKEYGLTKKQSALVKCLVEAGGRVHSNRLTAAADSDQTVPQIMRNKPRGRYVTHPLYGTLIKTDGKGNCYLDREALPPDG